MNSLVIKGGTVVLPNGNFVLDVAINDGKIVGLTENICGEFENTINAQGKYIFPGFIDTHVHSRDASRTDVEDFNHSTLAAAAGGITTIFEMPNASPAIIDKKSFAHQLDNYSSKAHVDFGMWALCLGNINNNQIQELADYGVVGFKFFWGYSIDKLSYQLIYNEGDNKNVILPLRSSDIYEIFKEVQKTGKQLAIHAENADLIRYNEKIYRHKDGLSDYDKLLKIRSEAVETSTVSKAIEMSRTTGCKLHILHVSSQSTTELVEQAQNDNISVTCETCPQYLFLNKEDYQRIGPRMKVYPPIRESGDSLGIMNKINAGVVSHVCSDHAPHKLEDKLGNIFEIPSGMCGVETLVPLMVNAVSQKLMTHRKLAEVLSESPAKMYGMYPQKGSLIIGTDADITIIDFNNALIIKEKNLHSKSKVTAFDQYKVKGKPFATIVRGHIVMIDDVMSEKKIGKFVSSN